MSEVPVKPSGPQSDHITPEEDAISGRYVGLMAEVRDRFQAIDRSRRSEFCSPTFGHEYMAAEFGMLQFRMICELIALACIVAHGDVSMTRTGKFKKDYSADLIFKKLEDYHPEFFPRAVNPIPTPAGPDLRPRTDAMTKEEMIKLYHHCHDKLHRGRVKDILRGNQRHYDYAYLAESFTKLGWLLDNHVITLCREDGREAWVQMDAGGKVRWQWLIFPWPRR